MAQRRFVNYTSVYDQDEDKIVHVKKTGVIPKYFALVMNARKYFLRNKKGQVIVFTNREAANNACLRKGWPGNIGMGEEKFALFSEEYSYVLDPSLSAIPSSRTWRLFVYPLFGILTVSFLLFGLLKYSNFFEILSDFIADALGLR